MAYLHPFTPSAWLLLLSRCLLHLSFSDMGICSLSVAIWHCCTKRSTDTARYNASRLSRNCYSPSALLFHRASETDVARGNRGNALAVKAIACGNGWKPGRNTCEGKAERQAE